MLWHRSSTRSRTCDALIIERQFLLTKQQIYRNQDNILGGHFAAGTVSLGNRRHFGLRDASPFSRLDKMEIVRMAKFNGGRPYHGSPAVMNGQLRGATDRSDYFYFLCPHCPEKEILTVLDQTAHDRAVVHPYASEGRVQEPNSGFTFAFELQCRKCRFHDFVKISNMGWQGGSLDDALSK